MGCCQTSDSNEYKFSNDELRNSKQVNNQTSFKFFHKDNEVEDEKLSSKSVKTNQLDFKLNTGTFINTNNNCNYDNSPKIITKKEKKEISFGYNFNNNNHNSNELNFSLSSGRKKNANLIVNQKEKDSHYSSENINTKGNDINSQQFQQNDVKENSISIIMDSNTIESNNKQAFNSNKHNQNNQQVVNPFKRGFSDNNQIKVHEEEKMQSKESSQRLRKQSTMEEKCNQYMNKYGIINSSKEGFLIQEQLAKEIESNINKNQFRPIEQSKSIETKAQYLLAQILKKPIQSQSEDTHSKDLIVDLINQKPVIHKKKKKNIPKIFEE